MRKRTVFLWALAKNNILDLHPVKRAASGCCEADDIVAYAVKAEIDLNKLTPAARFIAERINSTLRSGKPVRCYAIKTEVELMREAGYSEKRIQQILKAYGELPQPYMDYAFDIYRHDVSPEKFLNSSAEIIARQSTHMRIDDDIFNFEVQP